MKKTKASNSYLKTVFIIFVTFIVLFFVFSFYSLSKPSEHQHKMFSDIESLNILSPYATKEIEEDEYLGTLSPTDSFTYKIKWDKKVFYVYAYVFENDSQCMQYIKNRKIPYYDNESYHLSGNIFFTSKYIVYSNNKLLYIDGPDEDSLMDFLDFIGQEFDIIL